MCVVAKSKNCNAITIITYNNYIIQIVNNPSLGSIASFEVLEPE